MTRLDVYLTERGLVKSRTKAASCIAEGRVLVNGAAVEKAAYPVSEGDAVVLMPGGDEFVGRGGVKLAGALDVFGLDVRGAVACDIGASTGGFTDCLLRRGAKRVYAVDAGSGQLDPSLRADPRVISLENRNARYLTLGDLGERCTVLVMDVSFISQTRVLPALSGLASEGAILVSLIKPQFECGREAVGKKGVVRDKRFHLAAIRRVLLSAEEAGFCPMDLCRSVLTGGDGNVEYLFWARYLGGSADVGIPTNGESALSEEKLRGVVHGTP